MDNSITSDQTAPVSARDLAAFAEHWNQSTGGATGGTPDASILRLLSLCAALTAAKAAVEVGSSFGTTGLALFAGMPADGVLTTVDPDRDRIQAAREAFAKAGVGHSASRLIPAAPAEVLPRLTDGGYDLFLSAIGAADHAALLEQAGRLLRPGGIAVFLDIADAADPAKREPGQLAVRSFTEALAADERWLPGMLPLQRGVVLAVLR